MAENEPYFFDDDLHFDTDDTNFAEELQFQEAILFSLQNPNSSNQQQQFHKTPTNLKFVCEICTDKKPISERFPIAKCNHTYCKNCITKYIALKVQETIQKPLTCPGLDCKSVIDIESCRTILPNDVLLKWDVKICESMIVESQKFYCPYKDCSGLVVNDGNNVGVVRESECPFCHRLFCAECKVPWHSGLECREFKTGKRKMDDDKTVIELAKKKKWRRCPSCKFFVDRRSGCLHMTCRCGYEFCYACGAKWNVRYDCQCQRK